MRRLSPLVIIGPSGVGKSAVVERLVTTGRCRSVRTYTTRPKRVEEDDSCHDFVSRQQFEVLRHDGLF